MANHITVNGQTYTSVDEMPFDVRRQYEAAMQLLSRNTGAPGSGAKRNINISATGSDPSHRVLKVVTQTKASRIVVDGKEYGWEDVPPELRAALQSAGVAPLKPARNGFGVDQTNSVSIGCQAAALAFFCAGLTLIGVLVFAFVCLPPIVHVLETRSWVPVPCQIVSSSMSAFRPGPQRGFYFINVVYNYSYNGRSYQSNRYRLRQFGGTKAQKEQVLQRLSPGSSATCFVKPGDPSQAVMERDLNLGMSNELIPLAFAGVGIAGILWSVHLRRRLRAI